MKATDSFASSTPFRLRPPPVQSVGALSGNKWLLNVIVTGLCG